MRIHDAPRVFIMHHAYLDYDFLKPKAGIRFVTKWHAMEVERFLTRPISISAVHLSEFRGFPVFIFYVLNVCYFRFVFGRTQEDPRSIHGAPSINLEAAGDSKDHFESILDFSRYPKIMRVDFRMFS
jgi:hypothetical protein